MTVFSFNVLLVLKVAKQKSLITGDHLKAHRGLGSESSVPIGKYFSTEEIYVSMDTV